jgi:hypothetical protein
MKPTLAAFAIFAVGCAGTSFGHAPTYVPLDSERAVVDGVPAYDATAVQKHSDGGTSRRLTLFGVVESRSAGPGGQALLRVSVRELEPANVCRRPGDDDSCRVTVSDKDRGALWVLVPLREDDNVGARAVGQRSLVRVVGSVGQDVSPADGAAIVHAAWYRHWPVSEYVTPATAGALR